MLLERAWADVFVSERVMQCRVSSKRRPQCIMTYRLDHVSDGRCASTSACFRNAQTQVVLGYKTATGRSSDEPVMELAVRTHHSQPPGVDPYHGSARACRKNPCFPSLTHIEFRKSFDVFCRCCPVSHRCSCAHMCPPGCTSRLWTAWSSIENVP